MNKDNNQNKIDDVKQNGIELLYGDRCNFCVIALTGYTASGCSRLARYMENPDFFKDGNVVRSVENLKIPDFKLTDTDNESLYFCNRGFKAHEAIAFSIFKRKFTVCHNFIEQNYKPFRVIKYSKVIWLMALIRLMEKSESEDGFIENVESFFNNRFQGSTQGDNDKDYTEVLAAIEKEPQTYKFSNFIKKYPDALNGVYDFIKTLDVELKSGTSPLLREIFESKDCPFNGFYYLMNHWMFITDYYFACFFYHRLGSHLRKGADLTRNSEEIFMDKGFNAESAYDVVKFMTKIIRSLRTPTEGQKQKQACRIVIDSIRTSLEARYLKERYSGFYLIAVHDEEGNTKKHLENKMLANYRWPQDEIDRNKKLLDLQIKKILFLGKKERANDDYEKGFFGAPNVEQCVADAEIHISNNEKMDSSKPYFCTMGEQWMKFASLIFHPGIITPSSEERCMVVAYSAKFNSGCVSRQVGAVITNSAHSIRTIGWNDVPYGQTPCGLRSLNDFAKENELKKPEHSDFEQGRKGMLSKGKYQTMSFPDCVLKKYQHLNDDRFKTALKGLPLAYCFKSLHNEFEGEKNQVHTRSLHAEENAIMQMARFGGQGLENGIIYVTASPCELCCKKLYQIGVRKIVYIDEYPGISRQNIIAAGYKRPQLKQFQGAYGTTYFKLYQPFMPIKDELKLRLSEVMPQKEEMKMSECEKVIYDFKESLPGKSINSPEELARLGEEIKKYLTNKEAKLNS